MIRFLCDIDCVVDEIFVINSYFVKTLKKKVGSLTDYFSEYESHQIDHPQSYAHH